MPPHFEDQPSEHDGAVIAGDLPARAEQRLRAGELRGYRELFGEARRIEDVHRRYWAAGRLIEQGLAAAAAAPRRRLPATFAAVADGALEALEREPREPKLLNYAGVALYELWGLDSARALFEAARRLDPRLPQVDRNLAELARRARVAGTGRARAPLHPALPALERRALALAERARPAEGMRLSLCMIVRDEQEMLPRCLAAVADAVQEIVIVDTGSTDGTIEIARSFGAKVIEREWTGSFAQARNVSFDAARGDWLMYLDADEVLVREDVAELRALTGRTWREAFYLAETNYTGELGAGAAVTHNALRVFRNRPDYRFEGRLHEQIARRLPGYLPERLEATSVRIEHYGYLGAVRQAREKSRRNVELLRLQQAEGPPTPFLHYNLGAEHAAAGDAQAALAELERAWRLMEADPERDSYEFAPALANRLVKALRACGLEREAIEHAEQALERFPGFTDLVLEQAAASLSLGHGERAIELYERCIEMGDAPRHYTATVGCGAYRARIGLGEALLAQGRYGEAASAVSEIGKEAGVTLPAQSVPLLYACLDTLLRMHDFDGFQTLYGLLARTPLSERERRGLLADLYVRHGFHTSAAEEWMAICAREPDPRALVGLARVAQARGMSREAADFARAALERDPNDPAAAELLRRAELAAAA